MTEHFDGDWLALREPFDARARSPALAARLAAALPARPHLLDLGAGTGSLLRWLAPKLNRAQHWTLVDADPALLQRAFAEIEERAILAGWPTTWPRSTTLLVHSPAGAWRVEALVADLAAPRRLPLDKADAVVCSALCDLVSARWLRAMAAALRVPFYAALNVDGHEAFLPPHPLDRLVAGAFRRDQRRDKGFAGRALGPAAPAAMAREFRARGFAVATAPSPWIVRPGASVFADTLAQGHAGTAGAAGRIWAVDRSHQARRGQLGARIGHTDLLALPA
jgi:SAM-dependent methyltransferase